MVSRETETEVAVIGAGPAGLTAAYLLSKKGIPATVVEADPIYMGGLSKTVAYRGYLFDIGGHRFFSKSRMIEDLWTEILPEGMLQRPRSSRIYYRGKFFAYPLRAGEAFFKLGPIEAARCALSYLKACAQPIHPVRSFEDWVTNQFGARLFRIFFKTYTEKVWGMDCSEISADWAAQRIKGLSMATVLKNALVPAKWSRSADRSATIKTLIDTFRYPERGPGMMWDACAAKINEMGGTILKGRKVVRLHYDDETLLWRITHVDSHGEQETVWSRHVISSAPIRSLLEGLTPRPSPAAVAAARALKYRDFLIVALIVKGPDRFPDNWVYIHDPSVRVGRIQNFKSWSPHLVPEPGMNCYGLEYFCFEGDGLWTTPDEQLIVQAKAELTQIGLLDSGEVTDGCVVRQTKAYPVYDDHYALHVDTIRAELEDRFPTLHLVGRNGMHKYNNQDHAMMTAILCVQNIMAERRIYDLWQVNQDAEYLESARSNVKSPEVMTGERQVPRRLPAEEVMPLGSPTNS
jgi:protoporphyrinogen oxidase